MVGILALIALPCFASAETFFVDLGHDGRVDKVIVSQQGHVGLVEMYESGVLAGKFTNLVVDQPAISSQLVALAGGGLAIEIESDASRNKFHIISPITKEGGRFYVGCNYKTVYDTVDEARSVGAWCKHVELGKFDVFAAIADDGLMLYSEGHRWLQNVAPAACKNAVGIEYGNYRIVRCAAGGVADTKNQEVIVFNRRDELLFSTHGYELIPGNDGLKFVLSADLPSHVVNFEGDLACIARPHDARNDIFGKARMGGRLEIGYALANAEGCINGNYYYLKKNVNIELSGVRKGALTYLLELSPSRASTGLFVIDRLSPDIHGAWVSVPPKSSLSIN